MSITEAIVNFAVDFIDKTGYISVTILMSLESMVAPVPSEAVMPFVGFLIASGKFTWAGAIFFSTLGSIIGSLISYYVGLWGGRPLVDRYGKYLLLNHHHLDLTEKFFKSKGDITILICRFIPIVRHLISIPAGIGKMNIFKFTIYTIAGAALWNTFLTYVGFELGKNWAEVLKYSHIIDIVVILLLVILLVYSIYKYYSRYQKLKAN